MTTEEIKYNGSDEEGVDMGGAEVEQDKVFDCFEDGCGECTVCKYLNFLDWAESVGKPEGSIIKRDLVVEDYLKRKEQLLTSLLQKERGELEKARHDWLRDEIVKLEGMKIGNTSHTLHCIKGKAETHTHCIMSPSERDKTHDQALQTIIDRYQSELEQPTI